MKQCIPHSRSLYSGYSMLCRHHTTQPYTWLSRSLTTQSVPSSIPSPRSSTSLRSKPSSAESQKTSPLAPLSTSAILRSWLLMSISSKPVLMNACVYVLQNMLKSRNILFDVRRNAIARWLFKNTFYAQFCAGENRHEVRSTIQEMHKVGYKGIILEYASELLEDAPPEQQANSMNLWKEGLLDTITMTEEGDFVGLKWSGMGTDALHRMQQGQEKSTEMELAMKAVCDAASNRNIRLLPAAEPQNANAAVDAWNVELCHKYNSPEAPQATVYNTYQCYLKSTPSTLAKHMADAAKNNFRLGIKLVRGAYLETEPRHLIWDTKEQTDKCYDKIAEAILKQEYNDVLKPAEGATTRFPKVDLVLATHNQESVTKAKALRDEQVNTGTALVPLSYAQLQGMADEVSCALVQDARLSKTAAAEKHGDIPEVYKCITWGTVFECLNYLMRRASENKDAMSRTTDTRDAMRIEFFRRLKATFGLGRGA